MNPFKVKVENPETKQTNEVTIVEYTPGKGKGAGFTKLIPDNFFTTLDLKGYINLWGEDKLLKAVVRPKIMQILTNLTNEATTKVVVIDGREDEQTETDEGKIQSDYSEMFGSLSPRGESAVALGKQLAEIQDQQSKLADLYITFDDVTTAEAMEIRRQLSALKADRKEVELAIATKKQKNAQENAEPVAA